MRGLEPLCSRCKRPEPRLYATRTLATLKYQLDSWRDHLAGGAATYAQSLADQLNSPAYSLQTSVAIEVEKEALTGRPPGQIGNFQEPIGSSVFVHHNTTVFFHHVRSKGE
jgi:hypothetical protein